MRSLKAAAATNTLLGAEYMPRLPFYPFCTIKNLAEVHV
jgi:hypothetical protein